MFNNRQSRRRFRLGNITRLVQLRQSVSHLPPDRTLQETSSQSPPQSPPFQQPQSPSFPPPPTQFPSPIPSPSTLPHVSPKSNSSPPSPPMSKLVETHRSLIVRSPPLASSESHPQPLASVPPLPRTPEAKLLSPPPSTPKATEESQSLPSPPHMAFISIDETPFRSPLSLHVRSPSLSKFDNSQLLLPPHEVKNSLSWPSTPTLNFQPQSSPPLSPSKAIGESQFRSSPPSLSESSESHSSFQPPEAKILPSLPSTLKATEESQPQPLPPPSLSKTFDKTRLRSSTLPFSLAESGESQQLLQPPNANFPPSPPSTLKVPEESQSQLPPPLPPSKSINETRFLSSPSSPPSTPPPEANVSSYLPTKLNSAEEFQPQPPPPLLPSESIHLARFRSSPPPSDILPQSLSESRESQPPLSPTEAKIPPSSPSTLITPEKSKPQTPPPLPLSKSIDRTRLPSSPPPSKISPQSLSESSEYQPSLPSPESKIPVSLPSTLNATGKSKHQPPPPLAPSKSIDEIRFRSSPLSQASPLSVSDSDKSQPLLPPPEAEITPSPPLTLNATKESQPQQLPPPLMPPNFIDETRSQSPPISPPALSKSIEEPKSTPPLPESDQQSKSQTHSSPLLSPKTSENLQSQSPMPPPPPPLKSSLMKEPIPSPSSFPATITTSPLKSKITTSLNPSLPQIKPNSLKPFPQKFRNTESPNSDHNQDQNHSSKKPGSELIKITKTGSTGEVFNRGRAVGSETIPEPMIKMFINSNVQGINMSLSLDSSSIDHAPGVHLNIDYDQSCDFSSQVF